MLLSTQIAVFSYGQYLLKQCMDINYFLHRNIHQRKIAYFASTFDWACPGMHDHVQIYTNLTRVHLGSFRVIAKLSINQNERLINL